MLSSLMLNKFNEIFKVPEVCQDCIDNMVKDEEKRLVVAMEGKEFTITDAIDKLELPKEQVEELIDAAYKRGILNKVNGKQDTFISTDLYTRLKYAAVFDHYEVIPLEARKSIDEWYINAFIEKHKENFQKLRDNELDIETAHFLYSHTPFLLEQAYEVIDSADRIVALPCDCNQLSEYRSASEEVFHCIHFDTYADGYLERSLGKVLTREECKEVVRQADKKGYMHCINLNFKNAGPGFICNCGPRWCYPYRAAKIMGSESYYPLRRNVADYESDKCISCGLCIKRCPFGAFSQLDEQVEVKGKLKNKIRFNSTICQGCGLCANTCPENAIKMITFK